MTSKLEFLAQIPIFADLTDEEVQALADITREYEFEDGAIIAYQRDVADSLYIVKSGRLFARTVDAQGIVRESRSYMPGDYFGETWLFAPDAHPATVVGKGNGRLLIINGLDFLQFLDAYAEVLENLEPDYDQSGNLVVGLSPAAWEEAQKIRRRARRESTAVSLLPDELVEYQSRRSRWFLMVRLIAPTLFLFLTVMATLYFLPLRPEMGPGRWLFLLLPLFFGALFLLWFGFNLLDWSNDYFVITNKHLVHREFDLRTFRVNVVKISIEQIQSVQIAKPNLLSNLFNIGTARITTAAQAGTVLFDNIDDPLVVEQTLNRLTQRVRALDAGREQTVMRQSLEDYFQVNQPLQTIAEGERQEIALRSPPSLLRRYRWRSEEGDVITYRKHVFVLVREAAWPGSLLLLLIASFLILMGIFAFSLAQLWIVYSILFLIDFAWLIWEIEDWRNDTFQVSSQSVVDIDRRPFGFGESRKEARINNIQNVSADRPGLLQTIFNFGKVSIETAGADSDIVFEDVPQPSVIQSDIFKRLDQFRQTQRVKEGSQRRKEYAVLLDVYKQAMEQGRIPRRTPPPGEIAP